MPYIRVQVLGGVSAIGNGKMIVDGQLYINVKQGQMIYVAPGTHSVAYETTLSGTRCSTVCDFASDSMLTAFVIDEDGSVSRFVMGSCSQEETQRLLGEASELVQRAEIKAEKEKREDLKEKLKMTAIVIGAIIFVIWLLFS